MVYGAARFYAARCTISVPAKRSAVARMILSTFLRPCSPSEHIDDDTDSDVIRRLLVSVPVYCICDVSLAKLI